MKSNMRNEFRPFTEPLPVSSLRVVTLNPSIPPDVGSAATAEELRLKIAAWAEKQLRAKGV